MILRPRRPAIGRHAGITRSQSARAWTPRERYDYAHAILLVLRFFIRQMIILRKEWRVASTARGSTELSAACRDGDILRPFLPLSTLSKLLLAREPRTWPRTENVRRIFRYSFLEARRARAERALSFPPAPSRGPLNEGSFVADSRLI